MAEILTVIEAKREIAKAWHVSLRSMDVTASLNRSYYGAGRSFWQATAVSARGYAIRLDLPRRIARSESESLAALVAAAKAMVDDEGGA